MDIFIAKDSTKTGPYPLVEVISMLESGSITPEMKAWHQGCDTWMSLKTLPILEDYFQPKPNPEIEVEGLDQEIPAMVDSVPQEEVKPENLVLQVTVPGPWLRFMARMFDVSLYMMLYFTILRYTYSGPESWMFFPEINQILLYWCVPYIVIEAVLVSLWGTTPGKAILGIRVRGFLGEKLPIKKSLTRSLWVMVMGMGCFISLFPLIAMFLSWWGVRKTGVAPWDIRLGAAPMAQPPISPTRYLKLVVVFLILMIAFSHVLEPWMPQIQHILDTLTPPN